MREFANGKALGSYAGLCATPYSSGGTEREQGISKAGNRRVRTAMVELAWLWQRYQPGSAQVSWFRECVGGTGLDLAIPDHATSSRQAETLSIPEPKTREALVHVLVDSIGLRPRGPGEWLIEKHGSTWRRVWRKLRLGVNADIGQIDAVMLTGHDVDDAAQVGPPRRDGQSGTGAAPPPDWPCWHRPLCGSAGCSSTRGLGS